MQSLKVKLYTKGAEGPRVEKNLNCEIQGVSILPQDSASNYVNCINLHSPFFVGDVDDAKFLV